MRKVFVALTAAFALVAFLSACGMGLEPAKTDTTSVSLSLTVMSPLGSGGSTDAGRAIIPDGGYLYVRMLGGPTADTPSFLGPYQVTATSSTVSITDIPAGQYDGMFLLYADREVHDEEVTIEGVATTLGQIFSLPDTDFRAFVEGDEEYEVEIPTEPIDEELFYKPHPVDVLLAGRASIAKIESPLVVEGKANSFPVTMIPVTPYRIEIYPAELGQTLYLNELLEGTDSFRGFIEIDGVDSLSSYYPAFSGSVKLTFANESTTEAMVVNHLYVYDGDGRLLAKPPVTLPVQMTNDMPYSVTVHTSFNEIFFYLDVSGGTPAITITLDEGGTEPVDPVDPLPELDEITGSLDLADYMSNFDTVDSVFFSTTPAVSLEDLTARNTAGETPTEGIVGWGGLTANPTNGYHDFIGTIYSDFAGRALYLIVVGEKYGQPVLYASTEQMTVNSSYTEYSPSIMTPLVQYVVVYMGTTGLQSNINDTATVSIGMSDGPPNLTPEPTVFGDGVVQELDLYNNGTLYSSVVAMLTDGEGYVVLNPEDYWGASTVYSITLEVVAGAPVSHREYELNVNDAFIYINIPLT